MNMIIVVIMIVIGTATPTLTPSAIIVMSESTVH